MIEPDAGNRMREDWNSRAREDAHYYVAFGRRRQDEAEFFATGSDIVHSLERELKRLPAGANRRSWRALEIGCGPGRLMRPMSGHFGEIHGVDVSDEMIRLARENLRGVPHAHAHATEGSDLAAFADESFDFVYSYAVFQHIPSRAVVFSYLREARRVLKNGGILRCQINGLPETAARYDTWSGVRIGASELADFARAHDFQLLHLEGVSTQYMWVTMRKRPAGWVAGLAAAGLSGQALRIRRITNAYSSEPVAPARGRFASISLWCEGLPEECGLNTLDVFIGGGRGVVTYIGPPESDGLQQVNAMLPPGVETGLQTVEVCWRLQPIAPPASLRVIPPPPLVPRVVSVSDGIDLMSGHCIRTGSIKIAVEEILDPSRFQASIDGVPVEDLDTFRTDPLLPRYEINFRLPPSIHPGTHQLEMRLGARVFPPVGIDVVG